MFITSYNCYDSTFRLFDRKHVINVDSAYINVCTQRNINIYYLLIGSI